ncbi:hypothetical protein [Circoviridae sp.]|nr:hypothetical protein [Circoviridae sp.]UOF79807.1 hypothetical protein [Circoviridae sp.]
MVNRLPSTVPKGCTNHAYHHQEVLGLHSQRRQQGGVGSGYYPYRSGRQGYGLPTGEGSHHRTTPLAGRHQVQQRRLYGGRQEGDRRQGTCRGHGRYLGAGNGVLQEGQDSRRGRNPLRGRQHQGRPGGENRSGGSAPDHQVGCQHGRDRRCPLGYVPALQQGHRTLQACHRQEEGLQDQGGRALRRSRLRQELQRQQGGRGAHIVHALPRQRRQHLVGRLRWPGRGHPRRLLRLGALQQHAPAHGQIRVPGGDQGSAWTVHLEGTAHHLQRSAFGLVQVRREEVLAGVPAQDRRGVVLRLRRRQACAHPDYQVWNLHPEGGALPPRPPHDGRCGARAPLQQGGSGLGRGSGTALPGRGGGGGR